MGRRVVRSGCVLPSVRFHWQFGTFDRANGISVDVGLARVSGDRWGHIFSSFFFFEIHLFQIRSACNVLLLAACTGYYRFKIYRD